MKDIIFNAEQLLKHYEHRQALSAVIVTKMRERLDAGDITVDSHQFDEYQSLQLVDGLIDRHRRDFANALTKRPSLLIDLCNAAAQAGAVEERARKLGLSVQFINDRCGAPPSNHPGMPRG